MFLRDQIKKLKKNEIRLGNLDLAYGDSFHF